MTLTCADITSRLGELFVCAPHKQYIRLRTPMLYPDGDYIDLYLQDHGDVVTLSDLGETTRWLSMQTSAKTFTTKAHELVQDVCINHNVDHVNGQLVTRVKTGESLAPSVIRLAEACVRVSDISFTFRARTLESTTDEVAEFLDERQVPYERAQRLVGRSGRVWTPDFHTLLPKQSSLVYVLSTGSRSMANKLAEHVLAAWVDLNHLKAGGQLQEFVSLFDDTGDVWNEQQMKLLDLHSSVARISAEDEFLTLLNAA